MHQLRLPRFREVLSPLQQTGALFYDLLEEPVTREQTETVMVSIPGYLMVSLQFSNIHSLRISSKTFYLHHTKCSSLEASEYLARLPKLSTQLALSRRGASHSSEIDLLLFHPSYMSIPVPNAPSPFLPVPKNNPKGRRPGAFYGASPAARSDPFAKALQSDIIAPLIAKGFLAAQLVGGSSKWQGVVRLPDKQGKEGEEGEVWEDLFDRLRGVKLRDGEFRRLDIT